MKRSEEKRKENICKFILIFVAQSTRSRRTREVEVERKKQQLGLKKREDLGWPLKLIITLS